MELNLLHLLGKYPCSNTPFDKFQLFLHHLAPLIVFSDLKVFKIWWLYRPQNMIYNNLLFSLSSNHSVSFWNQWSHPGNGHSHPDRHVSSNPYQTALIYSDIGIYRDKWSQWIVSIIITRLIKGNRSSFQACIVF